MNSPHVFENFQENDAWTQRPVAPAKRPVTHRALQALAGTVALAVLYGLSRWNFLMFHGLVELFSIAVAWTLFLMAWSSRRIIRNDALLLIGIAYGFIGLLDLVHTMSYKGMGVFPSDQAANYATQLWIAARGLEGATLLLFPMFLGRHRLSGGYLFWGFAGLTAALLCGIFPWHVFPVCYIEGRGLTPFKKGAEYAVCLALVLAMALLYHRRKYLDVDSFRLMIAAMAATIMGEMSFTFYVSVYGFSNVAGHLFKIVSFYLILLALVRASLARPQATLFQGLERERKNLVEEGRTLSLLNQVSSLFLKAETFRETMETLPGLIAAHYKVPLVAIEIHDPETDEMVFVGSRGIVVPRGETLRVRATQTISGGVARMGRAFTGLDVRKHADYGADVLRTLEMVTFVCVPMHAHAHVIGTLSIGDRQARPDIVSASHVLQVVAGQLGQEINRLRTRAEIEVLLRNSPGIIFEIDRGGIILRMNKAPAGVDLGEVVGRSMYTFMNPDHHRRVSEKVKTVFETGQTVDYEAAGIGPHGRESIYHSVMAGVQGEADQIVSAIILSIDITERRQTAAEQESTLRMLEILNAKTELRDLMKSLLNFMGKLSGCDAVGIRLREGEDFPYHETRGFTEEFVEAEKYLCARDLSGQLMRDQLGSPVLECMCGNVLQGRFDPSLPFFTEFGSFVSNGTSKLLASTTEAERQSRTRNRCNGEGYESVMLVPLRSGGESLGLLQFNDRREGRFSPRFVSQVERMAGNVAMALAQRKADAALKESLERLKGFDLHSTEGVYRIDMGRPVPLDLAPHEMRSWIDRYAVVGDVNDALAKMYGLTPREMIGRPVTDFAPNYSERAMLVLAGEDRRVTNQETEDVDGEGNPLYLVENYHGVVEDGKLHAIWGAQRDITDRKRLEIRLQQAQKMESIGTLAGGIAHDFNNILFPIIGMSELLLEDLPRDGIEYENARQILRAGERGRDLVEQILAFSRQTEHKMIPLRPQRVIREVYKLVRSSMPSNIKITQSLREDRGLIMGDPTQLHQIAMNLVTNAYHAVETNGGSIQIRLEETDVEVGDLPQTSLPSGRYAVLSVSDTGSGIHPEHREKIFDPYFTTKEQGKGTGLGLAVAYGIIHEHGGDITVETEVGKGTSFHVYLPLIEKETDLRKADTPKILPTGNERILLVDDEPAILDLEKQILQRLGYHVTDRRGSSSALKIFSEDSSAFDLVISDMAMPEMTGAQLARRLLEIRPGIPIIICTGFSERIDKERAAAIGIKGLLMKPVIKSKLAETVREALNGTTGNGDG